MAKIEYLQGQEGALDRGVEGEGGQSKSILLMQQKLQVELP